MLLEDRVVSTDQLRAINNDTSGWLQLGPGMLEQLDPLGLHVLIPSGHLHISDEQAVMSCVAELQTGSIEPLKVRVLVPAQMFMRLPRAFDVLARVPAVAAAMAVDIEEWIAALAQKEPDDAAG